MGTAARRKKVTAAAAPLVIDESHLRLPWAIKDATVSEITCVGWLERIPGADRPRFMDEAWRVLVPSGVMRITCAYWASVAAVADYRHQWPPLCDNSFVFFNRAWREANKVEGIKCNFDFTSGYTVDAATVGTRNQETRDHMIKHYLNTIQALQITLTKLP